MFTTKNSRAVNWVQSLSFKAPHVERSFVCRTPLIYHLRPASSSSAKSLIVMAPVASPAPAAPPALTPEVKEIVKATVPVLKQHGSDIVQAFYILLFERYPQLQKQFNMDRQLKGRSTTEGLPAQVVALSRAILAYASNIDNPAVLLPVVTGICHKHVARAVEPLQCKQTQTLPLAHFEPSS